MKSSEQQGDQTRGQNNSSKPQPDRWLKILIYLFLSIYGTMALVALLCNAAENYGPTLIKLTQSPSSAETSNSIQTSDSNKQIKEPDVRDYIQGQVDRSYNRFFTQISFTLSLIGIFVWLFRRSIIEQLNGEITDQLKIQEFIDTDNKLKAQLRKNEILLQLSMALPPEEVFFQVRTRSEVQNTLKGIARDFDRLKQKSISDAQEISELPNEYLNLTLNDYIVLGDAYFCLEKYKEAEVAYKEVIDREVTDSHPKAFFGLGSAFWQQGLEKQRQEQRSEANLLFKQAIDSYKNALSLDPYYFVAHVHEGLATRRLDGEQDARLLEGIECFKDALAIEPNYYRAWYNMACYYTLLSDPDIPEDPNKKKAIQCLKRAIQNAPKLCKDLAGKDPDFLKIRNTDEFPMLMQYNPFPNPDHI
jgi:tetratricopeptide (TPR) repeat protein